MSPRFGAWAWGLLIPIWLLAALFSALAKNYHIAGLQAMLAINSAMVAQLYWRLR